MAKTYCFKVGIALDQLINTIFNGEPDETLSARAWRLHDRYWYARIAQKTLDCIFSLFGQKDHCYNAYLSEKNKKHLPDDY